MRQRIMLLVGAAIAALVMAAPAGAAPTTVEQTICDADGNHRLDRCDGEWYQERAAEICPPEVCYDPEPADFAGPLFNIVQLSDFQAADGESPARIEWVDGIELGEDALGGAYRPQEELGLQYINSMVRTLNEAYSPLSGQTPWMGIVTGDNADSMQGNETDWYIDVLDGRQTLNPNSGDPNFRPAECFPWSYPTRAFQGVRGNETPAGSRKFWEPDNANDGRGYSSNPQTNEQQVGRSVAVRDRPQILDRAQRPFSAAGLNFPWLTVLGNHDALWQGNVTQAIFDLLPFPPQPYRCWKDLNGDGFANPVSERVQPDNSRRFLTHQQWIARHFGQITPGPVGHGFESQGSDQGFYGYPLAPGWRLLGLDSVNNEGLHNGIVRDGDQGDQPQWEWLEGQLYDAQQQGEKVIVYAHHSLRTMNNTDNFRWRDQHCGLIDAPPWPFSIHQCADNGKESLESLFCRYGNVELFVGAHEHNNRIVPRNREDCAGPFWEITTSGHIDWPGQSRMIEGFQNRDGSLSVYTTMIDSDVPPDPGNTPDLNDPQVLASIAREVFYNDYQGRTGADGATDDARGQPEDRNVHLVLPAD